MCLVCVIHSLRVYFLSVAWEEELHNLRDTNMNNSC